MKLGSLSFLVLAGRAAASAQCQAVTFTLDVEAVNVEYSHVPEPDDPASAHDFVVTAFTSGFPINGTTTISDTFTVHGTYCRPPALVRSRDTLQLLVHGMSYTRSLWYGLGFGDANDWQLFATERGYHTLAVDLVGHGENPQRPDPLRILQGALHIEVLHSIIQEARTAGAGVLSERFGRVVWVGNSYGSSLGAHLAASCPADADALVLTGFSRDPALPEHVLAQYQSAAGVSPDRFGHLPPGYLTVASEAGRTAGYYGGKFDERLAARDYEYEDTIALGELVSPAVAPGAVPEYAGAVLVVTGEKDIEFCPKGPGEACKATLRVTGDEFFPKAAVYDSYAVPETGHVLPLHESAPEAMRVVHEWLDELFPAVGGTEL